MKFLAYKNGENNRAMASRNFDGNERASTSAKVTSCAAEIFFSMTFSISSRELAAVTLDVQFKIQPQTARVPVGRAEQNPVAVHDHQLGMVEGRRREPDVAAAFQNLPPHARVTPNARTAGCFSRAG